VKNFAAQLSTGQLDVGPALAITSERLASMDFSPSILASGVAIATIEEHTRHWSKLLENLWAGGMFQVAGWIVLGNVFIGFLLWQIERRSNSAFAGGTRAGLTAGVWCSEAR